MKTKVLYVEDEEDFQLLVEKILTRAGLTVVLAENARDAYRLMDDEQPDALLLDINLPDSTGYDMCSHIRQIAHWHDLPILMLTVRRKPEDWLRGFACGATDYLSKPIQPHELVERLLKSMARLPTRSTRASAEYKLVRAVVEGNRMAYHALIEKYRKRLVESLSNFIRNPAQLEDVMAQAFTTALARLDEFRGDSSFFTWLYRIAMNEFIALCRRPHALPLEDIAGDQENRILLPYRGRGSQEDWFARQEMSRDAFGSLEILPAPYRETLELFCLQDLSYEAIARKLRIPEGTVMSRLHKGRKLLQEAWARTPSALKT